MIIDCKGLLHASEEVEMALVVMSEARLNSDYISSSGTLIVSQVTAPGA